MRWRYATGATAAQIAAIASSTYQSRQMPNATTGGGPGGAPAQPEMRQLSVTILGADSPEKRGAESFWQRVLEDADRNGLRIVTVPK